MPLTEQQMEKILSLDKRQMQILVAKAILEKSTREPINSFPVFTVKEQKVNGQFKAGGKLYDFTVSPSGVSYGLAKGRAPKKDACDRVQLMKLDSLKVYS